MHSSHFIVLQHLSLKSESSTSLVSQDEAHKSKKMFAIPTSVGPVGRAVSSHGSEDGDSDFSDCLFQLFASDKIYLIINATSKLQHEFFLWFHVRG
jgi:hypothetical protein